MILAQMIIIIIITVTISRVVVENTIIIMITNSGACHRLRQNRLHHHLSLFNYSDKSSCYVSSPPLSQHDDCHHHHCHLHHPPCGLRPRPSWRSPASHTTADLKCSGKLIARENTRSLHAAFEKRVVHNLLTKISETNSAVRLPRVARHTPNGELGVLLEAAWPFAVA